MPVNWHGDAVMRKIERIVENKLDVAAAMIASAAKASMREPKSGRPGKQTRRSAPGEAPAVQIGHLARTITWEKSGPDARRIGTNVKYGLYLELGTGPFTITPKTKKMLVWIGEDGRTIIARKVRHPGIKARPFLRPALDKCKPKIQALFARQVD